MDQQLAASSRLQAATRSLGSPAGRTLRSELSVTAGAIRLGALDMAVASLLGSNLFDILIIAIDDLCYQPGPLLSEVSASHAASALSALIMTGLASVGLLYRPEGRVLRLVSWVSLGLLGIYLLNAWVLFLWHE